MKKNWTGIAIALGSVMLMGTIVWEIARTNPAYRFIVEPWAIRGYETTHGWVLFGMGLALFLGGMLALWRWSTGRLGRLVVLAYFVLAGTALGALFARDETSLTIGAPLGVLLALFFALIVYRFVTPRLSRALPVLDRGWASALWMLLLWAGMVVLALATIVGNRITLNTTVAALAFLALVAVYALAAEPRGLAGNRMLIYVSILSWFVVVTSGGAIRSTLLRLQRQAEGFSAQYPDAQVGGGWFVAVLATMILFVGAVGLWAKRRDLLIAQARAAKQREAAEKSAAEIKAAEEAYLAGLAAPGA